MEKLVFLISKALPALTLPLGTAIILIIIGLLKKSFKLILLSLIILYSFSTKIISEKLIKITCELPIDMKDLESKLK